MDEKRKNDRQYRRRMARQIPILGIEGQRKIASTKLAIVGVGGNGSAFTKISGLAGFRKMKLFDPDKLEIHNLNRFMLGGVHDVGKYKVLVAKRTLHRLFPGMRIDAFAKDIRAPRIWEKARQSNWLVDATDDDETRHFLQRKCTEDGVKMISVATGFVFRDGRLVRAGCRANRVRPGDGCLECQVLDDEPMEQAHVSLVIPNVIAAALAVDLLLREITGYCDRTGDGKEAGAHKESNDDGHKANRENFLSFDLINRILVAERVIPSCPHCMRG